MNMILICMTLPYENIVHIRHVLPCTRAPKIYIIATVKTEKHRLKHKSNLLYMCLKKCILCKNQEDRRPSEGEREGRWSLMATFTVLVKFSANTKA